MFNEIVLLFLGAVIGAFLSYFMPKVIVLIKNYYIENKKVTRKKLLEDNNEVYKWLLNYYEKHDNKEYLYNCKIGNSEVKIPFITKPEWLFENELDKINNLFEYAKSNDLNFPINLQGINKRQQLGHELFNNPALYLDWVEYKENQPIFHVKDCEYFELVDNVYYFSHI